MSQRNVPVRNASGANTALATLAQRADGLGTLGDVDCRIIEPTHGPFLRRAHSTESRSTPSGSNRAEAQAWGAFLASCGAS